MSIVKPRDFSFHLDHFDQFGNILYINIYTRVNVVLNLFFVISIIFFLRKCGILSVSTRKGIFFIFHHNLCSFIF